jgi:hypothetical protein
LNAAGLADFFVNDKTSVHYTVGNDGIYNIIRLGEKAAHAGDGKYRAYALEKTNVLAGADKPVITMIDGCSLAISRAISAELSGLPSLMQIISNSDSGIS